jgi:hypothetical protein
VSRFRHDWLIDLLCNIKCRYILINWLLFNTSSEAHLILHNKSIMSESAHLILNNKSINQFKSAYLILNNKSINQFESAHLILNNKYILHSYCLTNKDLLKILLFQLCFVQEKYGPSFWIIQRKREFHLLYKIYSRVMAFSVRGLIRELWPLVWGAL